MLKLRHVWVISKLENNYGIVANHLKGLKKKQLRPDVFKVSK